MSLNIANYFSPAIQAAEMKNLFKEGSYVGHQSMIPDVGDFMVIPWDQGKMIYHGADGYWLMSNVCRHRQAQILSGKGNAPVIVCNIHGWTYSSDGSLLGAPHFEETGGCDGLNRIQLLNCSGFLFTKVEGLEESVFDGSNPTPRISYSIAKRLWNTTSTGRHSWRPMERITMLTPSTQG